MYQFIRPGTRCSRWYFSSVVQVTKWVDTAANRRSGKLSGARAERRAQIVEAAARAIEEYGGSVGTAQIAERAGVQRPHVYRVFESKDDLDDEVGKWAASRLLESVRPTLTRTGTPPEIIHGVVAAAIGWAQANPNLYRFMAARQQTKATHRARLGRTRFLGEIVGASEAYLRASDLDVEPPSGVMAGLMGMVDASIIWWLDHEDETRDEVVERLTRQVAGVLFDLLAQLGLEIPEDMVFAPRA
jgi:AcrR family transcriptional regulator